MGDTGEYYDEGSTPRDRKLLGKSGGLNGKSYQNYIKDVSYTRVRIFPAEKLARTTIEERIESRLLMMLNYVVPPVIIRQCNDRDDVTCAQIIYRTMLYVGPASKEYCSQMMDILTKPRVVELSKLHDAMIQFRYARSRLRKYGHTEPEPSQLLETLKVAASALTEKDQELQFRFQHYLMKHSSVNGLVSEQTVQEMYDMIVENARSFVDAPLAADAKALQSRKRIVRSHMSRL